MSVAGLALLAAGCGDDGLQQVKFDADEYIAGVQYRDALGLVKRLAAFRDEIDASQPERWEEIRARWLGTVEGRFAEYEEAKISGWLPLEEDGINVIQGLAIGKGVYYHFEDLRLEEDGAAAVGIMEVVPGYEEHRFRGLPPGTKVYFLGAPLSQLQTLVLGISGEEQALQVPASVRLEWRFRWYEAIDVYPGGWAVEAIRVLEDRTEMTEIRRVF